MCMREAKALVRLCRSADLIKPEGKNANSDHAVFSCHSFTIFEETKQMEAL